MKLLDMTCPNCGSKLSLNRETGECACSSCGGKFLLDEEITKQQIEINNAENAGYEFEKGRQKAQAEARRDGVQTYRYSSLNKVNETPKKSNLKWWVLGWIFFFPIPLTIIVYRSKRLPKMAKIIILSVLWGYVAIGALISSCNRATQSQDVGDGVAAVSCITGFEYSYGAPEEIELTAGDYYEHGWVRPSYNRGYDFTETDVVFVSDNPEIATMTLSSVALTDYLYYRIDAVSEGDTYVYVISADGSVSSARIHVIVNGVTEAESISLSTESETLLLGETRQIVARIEPEDVVDQSLSWSSSNEEIVSVDDNGNITAVGAGEAVVTATTSNGLSADCSVVVDGSQRMVNLSFSSVRDDDYNIGDEWSFRREINGESVSRGDFPIYVGEALTIYIRYSEEDDNPDVGEATVNHTVTEEEFNNGFSIEIEVYVTENGGRNSGQSAHYITTFDFSVSE